MVSTGTRVWYVKVVGQLVDNLWTNIAIRWKQSGDTIDKNVPVSERGGLEMYVGNGPGVELVGTATLPLKNKAGNMNFTFSPDDCKIDDLPYPVITLGCAYNRKKRTFDYFGEGEYDELAIWNRQLVRNATMNELPFILGGFSKLTVSLFSIYS